MPPTRTNPPHWPHPGRRSSTPRFSMRFPASHHRRFHSLYHRHGLSTKLVVNSFAGLPHPHFSRFFFFFFFLFPRPAMIFSVVVKSSKKFLFFMYKRAPQSTTPAHRRCPAPSKIPPGRLPRLAAWSRDDEPPPGLPANPPPRSLEACCGVARPTATPSNGSGGPPERATLAAGPNSDPDLKNTISPRPTRDQEELTVKPPLQLLEPLRGPLGQRLRQGVFHRPGLLLHVGHPPLQLSIPLLGCSQPLLERPRARPGCRLLASKRLDPVLCAGQVTSET